MPQGADRNNEQRNRSVALIAGSEHLARLHFMRGSEAEPLSGATLNAELLSERE